MKVAEIRECLHRYIDKVEEKKVKAIYTLFEEEIYQVGEDYSDAFKDELDRRYMEYKQGGEVISMEEADREIDKLLKKPGKNELPGILSTRGPGGLQGRIAMVPGKKRKSGRRFCCSDTGDK